MSWLRSRIKTRKTIELSLTADDWDLVYASKEGAEACALRLNQLLEQCVNSRMGMKDTYHRMINAMETENAFGAADSEPLRVLDDILELVYGDSDV